MVRDCDYTRKHLHAYLGQDIDVREGERISLHLQHCPGCRAAYLQLYNKQESLRRQLRNWVGEGSLPEGCGLEIWSDLTEFFSSAGGSRSLLRQAWGRVRRAVRPAAIAAAVLALLLLISPFFFWLARQIPYYGPWASKLVDPAEHAGPDR
jgi:anti-sigma factor RsiW